MSSAAVYIVHKVCKFILAFTAKLCEFVQETAANDPKYMVYNLEFDMCRTDGVYSINQAS